MKILPSEITPYKTYLSRRRFIKGFMASSMSIMGSSKSFANHEESTAKYNYQLDENDLLNSFDEITNYNNYYEFGTNKEDPAKYSANFKSFPWTINIGGSINKPGIYNLEDILKDISIEDRIYRLRCVEGWSMVIPWQGFSLKKLIDKVEPHSSAKYIKFQTVYRPKEMRGQNRNVLQWPYIEGLRIDEALNKLCILSTGMYGHDLLNQNGAPIRLIVPWKYGFKSIKSIVKIDFVKEEPKTSWSLANPNEYGFYSNVNPKVDHPRWSQATERRIGEFFRRPTLLFNGYADEVAHLYKGMDLKKYY